MIVLPVPAFSDNYLWLLHNGRHAAVVDPGDAAPIQAALDRLGVSLAAILVTHHHGDHVGGLPALLARHRVPVFGPAGEDIRGVDHRLCEGDEVNIAELDARFRVLDVPGHTRGHIAYVGQARAQGLLFCGDTLFACGCGRLFEGTPSQMQASLAKLAALPGDTRVYCAHEYTLANIRFAEAVEPENAALAARKARDSARRDQGEPTVPSTIADELATNPFLRWESPAVKASVERRAGRALSEPATIFACLREWKNTF
ncbi:MAG: hydroxyacylglutathione hydrolase [Betaproteobacteria bacterium]|nr:hydroxyacylglutathione hydrolase [Betaproteobacteria bacterium]